MPSEAGLLASRSRLRGALDFDDERLVILLLDPCPDSRTATRFVFLTTMMWAVGLRVAGLMVRGPQAVSRARLLHRRSGARAPIALIDAPLSALVPASDVGVVMAGAGARAGLGAIAMLVAHAHSCGVPVVSPPRRSHADWYGPGLAARCVTASEHLRDFGGPLRALLTDRDLRETVAGRGREHARSLFEQGSRVCAGRASEWLGESIAKRRSDSGQ
ncbi:MAG: glycosyltransferase family 1 protein [Phycisphaeraceae bacterium]|nr:glycosyltransferase family 1 protein [Phycisphaeraceae bacterium]